MVLSQVELNKKAILNFRQYLQIPSVHPNVQYDSCVKFIEAQAKELNLNFNVYYMVPQKPIVILTWVGTDPSLPTILLNSHMDVVPVFEEKWTFKPFNADIHDNKIYARGAQDMKCVGIQYLEAVRRLKINGINLKRTIHLSFSPDEEIGGFDGMAKFILSQKFKNLNIGVALDEGMASPTEEFAVFNGERCVWNFHVHCPGNAGHGSQLIPNTAGEKITYIINKFYEFRQKEKQKLIDNPEWTIGDVTTINLTKIEGGVQTNVIPSELIISFDCRIPPETVDIKKWEKTIINWCKEAGSDIWIEYSLKFPQIPPTKFDDSNPYWVSFKKATTKLGMKLKPQIFTGGTDSRFLRGLGIPVIGFSPINNTPVLLHDHDEFLGIETFLKGIEIYQEILISLETLEDYES